MKLNKRIAIILMLFVVIFINPVYAINTTANSKNATNSKNTIRNITTIKKDIKLEELYIEGLNLQPSFNPNVYQYNVNLEGSQKQIEITAQANETDANIKIIGNDNLINGQNVITILVTDSKETSVTTYQIYVNKNVIEQEELNKHLEEGLKQHTIRLWAIRILIPVLVICVIILLILIYKKTKSKEYIEKKEDKKKNKKMGKHSKE